MSKLKNKAVSGVLWTSMSSVLIALVSTLLLFIKARFLSPTDFGVMAIINIFITIFKVIENFGMNTAIIQKDEVTRNDQSSLFFFQIILSLIIVLFLLVFTPIFTELFNMPSLRVYLPLLSGIVLFNGPTMIFTSLLEKNLFFKEISVMQSIREVFLFVVTTVLLILGYGLTGVVIGQVLSVAIYTLIVFYIAYKNNLLKISFHFKISEVKPYLKFGTFIFGKEIVSNITHHLDELIIGYFLPADILGLYYFSKNILNRLRSIITLSFSKVSLPLMSKLKNNLNKLSDTYRKISKYIGVFVFPIFTGLAITSTQFIPLFFGEEWLPSVVFFKILVIAYIPYIIVVQMSTSVLYSLNKPYKVLFIDTINGLLYLLLLLVCSWLFRSLYLIVILYGLFLLVKAIVILHLVLQVLSIQLKKYLSLFKSTIVSTIIMIVTVLAIQSLLFNKVSIVLELIISILVGITIYVIVFAFIDKNTLVEIKETFLRN